MSLQRLLLSQAKKLNTDVLYWAFPVTVGVTWFIWDALDEEWLISLNLASDPELLNKRVEKERLARLEALKKPKPIVLKSPPVKEAVEVAEEEEEEEEATVEDKEEPPADEDEEVAPLVEVSDDAGEDVTTEEEEEESDDSEEEEEEVVIKPLYDPIKGKKLAANDVWDNFTIKALGMNEDDDDDDEEEEEEEEEADEEE